MSSTKPLQSKEALHQGADTHENSDDDGDSMDQKAGDNSTENQDVDIILVHGLGRSDRQSWTSDLSSDDEQNRSSLVTDRPTRWRMFNYDSAISDGIDVFSETGLTEVAGRLLETIWPEQSHGKHPTRPMVILAYDFGGIIVKKALIMADRDAAYFNVSRSCRRLIFVNSPHRPSISRSWEDLLLGILLASPLMLSPSFGSNLATRLRRLSKFLEEVSIEFLSISTWRSILNLSHDARDGEGDHLILHSFSTSTGSVDEIYFTHRESYDEMYDLVRKNGFWKACVNRAREGFNHDYISCLSRLLEISPRFAIPDDQLDLCISEPDTEVQAGLDAWLKDQSSGILVMTGEQGTGKSLVARTLLRKVKSFGRLVAYFSFDEAYVGRASAACFLASVALQILTQDPMRFTRVESLVKTINASNAWSEAGLLSLFKALVNAILTTEQGRLVLVINGLHQCKSESSFGKILQALLDNVNNKRSTSLVKVAIFSQACAEIESLINSDGVSRSPWPSAIPKPMAAALAAKAISDRPYLSQIETHIMAALEKCKSTTEMLLVIKSLNDTNVNSTPRSLQLLELAAKIIQPNVPHAVSLCYRDLPSWGRTALGWIAHSKRPLTLKELGTALALTGSTAEFVPSFNPEDLPIDLAEDLQTIFGPLVRIEAGSVVFSDGVVRNLFLRIVGDEHEKRRRESEVGNPWKTIVPDDEDITAILLEYLSSTKFAIPVNKALSDHDHFVPPPGPLFNLTTYAARFLPAHVQACKGGHDQFQLAAMLMWSKLNSKLNSTAFAPDLFVADPVLIATQLGMHGMVERLETQMSLPHRQAVLLMASWNGYPGMVEFAIQGLAPKEELDCTSALKQASARGHDEIVSRLVDYMESASHEGWDRILNKLVCQAAELGYEEQAFMLIAKGADPNVAPEDSNETPLQLAARNGHSSIVHGLLTLKKFAGNANSGADTDTHKAIVLAAEKGHTQVVRHLLDAHAKIASLATEEGARTPLYISAEQGYGDVVELLLQAETKGNTVIDRQCGSLQNTPLIIACKKGHDKIARCLLDANADVTLVDRDGCTALYHALRPGDGLLAKVILRHAKSLADIKDIGNVFLRAAVLELEDIVRHCLEVEGHVGKVPLVNYADKEKGRTALHNAALNGHLGIVKNLLSFAAIDVDVEDQEGLSPLALAAGAGHVPIVASLLAHKADPRKRDPENYTIVSRIAKLSKDTLRHRQIVLMLLEKEVDVNATGHTATGTALHFAVSLGKLNITRALLQHRGINVNARVIPGHNALHCLAQKRHRTTKVLAELLIEAGTDPLAVDIDNHIPLHFACKSGNIPLMEVLFAHNPESLELHTDNGETAIHFGVGGSDPVSVTKWLIQHQADVNAKDSAGCTALMMAAQLDLGSVVRVLLEKDPDAIFAQNEDKQTALHYAARHGSLMAGKELLRANIFIISCKDASNVSALHLAIQLRNEAFARILLDDFYPDPGIAEGKAPASSLEDLDAADAINGETPLISAILRRQWKVMRRLLELGAGTETRDKRGRTALLAAIRIPTMTDFELLLSKVDVNAGGGVYATALHQAAEAGTLSVIKDLVKHDSIDVNKQGGLYGTALGAAVARGWTDIVDYLVALQEPVKVNVNQTDIQGRSPLHLAARRGAQRVLTDLCHLEGAEMSLLDRHGRTVLHFAAMSGERWCFMQLLADEKATWDIDAQDRDGWTVLHWACRQDRNLAIVQDLIDFGADLTRKASHGWTAENIAIMHGAHEVAELITNSLAALSTQGNEPATQVQDANEDRRPRRWKGGIVHKFVGCDSCLINPMIGVRWKCQSCDDFDLCFKCYWHVEGTHDSTHKFRSIPEGAVSSREPAWEYVYNTEDSDFEDSQPSDDDKHSDDDRVSEDDEQPQSEPRHDRTDRTETAEMDSEGGGEDRLVDLEQLRKEVEELRQQMRDRG